VIAAKLAALEFAETIEGVYPSIPPADKRKAQNIWNRYVRILIKWCKYHEECDLAEEAERMEHGELEEPIMGPEGSDVEDENGPETDGGTEEEQDEEDAEEDEEEAGDGVGEDHGVEADDEQDEGDPDMFLTTCILRDISRNGVERVHIHTSMARLAIESYLPRLVAKGYPTQLPELSPRAKHGPAK
jgi:hypothetical protein